MSHEFDYRALNLAWFNFRRENGRDPTVDELKGLAPGVADGAFHAALSNSVAQSFLALDPGSRVVSEGPEWENEPPPEVGPGVPPTPPLHVVLFVHGINTEAHWQNMATCVMQQHPHIKAYAIGYDNFSPLAFLSPVFTREGPIANVEKEVWNARNDQPEARLSVVAHSFGTYIISEILKRPNLLKNYERLRLHRLIFCGAVMSTRYDWGMVKDQVDTELVNDCGTRDLWPVMAEAFSFGYGATGTVGIKKYKVQNRFFDLDHSGFLKKTFVEDWWVPWIVRGELKASPLDADRPPIHPWISRLRKLKQTVAVLALLVLALFYLVPAAWHRVLAAALAVAGAGVLFDFLRFLRAELKRVKTPAQAPAAATPGER